jgi:hypothetical protein
MFGLSAYQRSYLFGALRDAFLLSKPVDEQKLRKALCALLSDTRR